MIIYRKLEPEEYERIIPMVIDFCDETNADDQAITAIMIRMGEGRTEVFTAENGKLCGMLGYCTSGEVAIPEFFYVLPEKRKGIIGGRLYQIVTKYVKGQGIKKWVPMVTADKEPIYTKLGFKRSKFILLEKEI